MARLRSASKWGPELSRRDVMKLSAAGVIGCSMSGWLEVMAQQAANDPKRRRACILLWMNGGPSQMDTFDLKPGHQNGGPFKEIPTSVPGIRISEHLPKIARNMHHMALIRSMNTREGDHGRGAFLMRTGYLPQGPVQYPTLGSLVAKELGSDQNPLPNFVSIAPFRIFSPMSYGPGFLGPQYAPLLVADNGNQFAVQRPGQNNYEESLRVQDLAHPTGMTREQADARIDLLLDMERNFVSRNPGLSPLSHQMAYDRAVRLMRTAAATAFNLEEEPSRIRDAYGRNQFGQGCLLARRLVERGVPFVEVTLGGFANNNLGWDTHQQNFTGVQQLSQILDPAWATLMEDLQARGLLDSTLIVWMGEFGRTPRITPQQGRDHFPNAWTTVLAGGGINGGQVHGRTSADGTTVEDTRPTSVPDFIATIAKALGIDPTRQNMSNVGRPIRFADLGAQPIESIVG
jgi:Protein of unknown function (DUF1501)